MTQKPLTILIAAFLLIAGTGPARAAEKRVPTVDELMSLKSAGGPRISPDGKWAAYTVTEADLKQDAYITHIWLADISTGGTFQLTRGEKSCTGPDWSPDGRRLAFISSRLGDKSQLFVISPDGGEAVVLTKSETGVNSFAWSPDGRTMAFSAAEPAAKEAKARKDAYADFEIVRREYTHTHLFTFDVADSLKDPQPGRQRTRGHEYTVGAFAWSPDGRQIAFSGPINPDLIQGGTSDAYILDTADDAVRKIVSTPGPDNVLQWSPDGKSVLLSSAMGDPDYFAANTRLALVSAAGGLPRSLTDSFDESPAFVAWTADGLYFQAQQKTAAHLFKLDPKTLKITRVTGPDAFIGGSFSFTRDGKTMAFTSASPTTLSEICVSGLNFAPRVLTDMTAQAGPFLLGAREVITWKSRDGTMIDGVLIKPADFNPAGKYALLCVIHGGPTGVDRPALLSPDARTYPADIWAARGALILKVNYRGSAGYGAKFRRLNYRNLGVGDAWDVLSGVEALIAKGWVDPGRIGCMGWSQGGYISAFLTTHSNVFKAISVGAGISNWATYYYNTDITPFTINYLGANPADDPAIYLKTSPMTSIKTAGTPTLIQHGELDRRVPIANGYELRQGLEDRGVPVEMIVYKGFGHGISKPKSMAAVMRHNLAWFGHYIFGDPKPDLLLTAK